MNTLEGKVTTAAEASLCTLAAGAIYAAANAERLGYLDSTEGDNQWGRDTVEQAFTYCRMIARGETLSGRGAWVSGYYFNDAMFRVYIAFERMIRLSTGLVRHTKGPQLSKAALSHGMPAHCVKRWEHLRNYVNNLKHLETSSYMPHPLKFDDLVFAIDALVSALEWMFTDAKRNA